MQEQRFIFLMCLQACLIKSEREVWLDNMKLDQSLGRKFDCYSGQGGIPLK